MTYRNSFLDKLSAHDSLWDKLRKRRNPFEEQPPVSAEAEFPAGMPEGEQPETPQSLWERLGNQLSQWRQENILERERREAELRPSPAERTAEFISEIPERWERTREYVQNIPALAPLKKAAEWAETPIETPFGTPPMSPSQLLQEALMYGTMEGGAIKALGMAPKVGKGVGAVGKGIPKKIVPEGKLPIPEPGMPEAGLQPEMFGKAPTEVRPKGKGVLTQAEMEDYMKLRKAQEAEGVVPEPGKVFTPKEQAAYEAEQALAYKQMQNEMELEVLKETLANDPVAKRRFQMGTKIVGKGETRKVIPNEVGLESLISIREGDFPEYLTVKQAQAIKPHADWTAYTQEGTKKYNRVPTDAVLDDIASELGLTVEELGDRVLQIRKERAQIRKLEPTTGRVSTFMKGEVPPAKPIISETPKVEAPIKPVSPEIPVEAAKPSVARPAVGGEPPIVPPKSVVPKEPVIKDDGKLWLPEPPRTTTEYMPFARKEMAGSFRKKVGVFDTVEQAHQQVLKARDMGDNVVPYVQSYIHQVGNVTKEFGLDELGMATKVGNPGNHSLAINDVLSNPTRYTLTPTQLELAKREGFVYKEALKLAKSYGVQISELPGVDEAWQYIARRVKGKYNPLTGQYDMPPVPTGGFKMGAKISAQKERLFDEMFEGVDKGFLYENPDQVMAYHIKGIYRLIGNKQAENMVKPLTRAITKEAPLQFGERAIAEPALKSRAAATELANAIDKIYAIETVPKAVQVAADISGAMVGQVAALDISAPFIQGLPVLAHDLKMGLKGKPSAIWAKSYGNMFKAIKNPESIHTFRHASPEREALYKRAGEAGVATGQSEFVSGVGTVQNLLGKIPKGGKTLKEGYRQSWGRMGEAYSDFLEIARIKMFEQMEQSWVRQGGNIYELGAVINRMTGMASAKARGVGLLRRSSERIAAFAPNYLRANILLMRDLVGRGATAKEVWSSLAAFAGVGATFYYAEEKLRGQEPKMKPWAKKWGGDGADAFTTVIGDTRTGLGSWFYGMIKTIADVGAMAVDDPGALVKFNDQHPIMRFAKSKRGAAWGLVSDLATGRNFFGQPFKSPTDYLMRIVEAVAPIASQSMITQEPKGGIEQVGAELMGMRAYPTPAKRVAKAVNETMSKLGQPDTESLQKKLEKATTPERKAEIMKQGNVFNISDMGQAIDDVTFYLTLADMPADKYPAISRARVKARKQINEFYSGIPTDKRDSYRVKNPELDAMLFFWGRVEAVKTAEAMRIVRQMMSDYGIPESAIPGLVKQRATPTLPSLPTMGTRKSTMPSPLQQYRERRSTMPSPLRGR